MHVNREYIRKICNNPGEHKNIDLILRLGRFLGMSDRQSKEEWLRCRKAVLDQRASKPFEGRKTYELI